MKNIPYGKQDIRQQDIDAVVEVLRSDFLTQGPVVPEFERCVATYCGASYAVAANSATSALHIACLALDLKPGDRLWTSPITFVASANCALYCGADVDFVDVDPETYNMCPKALAQKLATAAAEGKLPKVVVAVHLCGQSCEMEAIRALSQQFGFFVIEDASHAIGGRYRDMPIGNCQYSDITVFSFHPVKIVTSAEGGMAVTNDPVLAARMDLLRSHGITRDPTQMTMASEGAWYYQQIALGYNYRMTELQAALGVSQMSRVNEYVARRHELADQYKASLNDLPIRLPVARSDCYSALHLYVVRVLARQSGASRKDVFSRMRECGIGVNVHYIPVHTQPYYLKMGFKKGDFPVAEAYYDEALSLPLYPAMDNGDVTRVVDVLRDSLA